MSDDLRARYLPRFVDVALRRIARGLEAVTPDGPGQPMVARTELHSLAGEAGILGLAALAADAHQGELDARRWLDDADPAARVRCAVTLRRLGREIRTLAAAQGLASPAPVRAGQRRVVVVDDSPLVADEVCDGLRADGCEAVGASDVETTLRLVRELRPHVVLMDVNMPGLSLGDLCARTREAAGPATVAICLLSGAPEDELTEHARRVGADAYISKVAGLRDVIAQVRRIAAEGH